MTSFEEIYDAFFSLITDDFYMEITEEQTREDCESLLMASLPLFEFPSQVYTIKKVEGKKYFEQDLSLEEINILATGMLQIWLQRQIWSIEVIRQKFSGSDFKLTSQASHLQRLMSLLEHTKNEHRRLQMLHSRRRVKDGKYESTFDLLVKRK